MAKKATPKARKVKGRGGKNAKTDDSGGSALAKEMRRDLEAFSGIPTSKMRSR